MRQTVWQVMLFFAILVWGALYLYEVAFFAATTGNRLAWLVSIVCAGVTYLSYCAQLANFPRTVSYTLVVLSIATGAGAGIMLLR